MESAEWGPEDRALMLAYKAYQDELCPGCGQPKATAWHPDNQGWWDADHEVTCHPCTAIRAAGASESGKEVEPVRYIGVTDTRDYDKKPLPALDPLGRVA